MHFKESTVSWENIGNWVRREETSQDVRWQFCKFSQDKVNNHLRQIISKKRKLACVKITVLGAMKIKTMQRQIMPDMVIFNLEIMKQEKEKHNCNWSWFLLSAWHCLIKSHLKHSSELSQIKQEIAKKDVWERAINWVSWEVSG